LRGPTRVATKPRAQKKTRARIAPKPAPQRAPEPEPVARPETASPIKVAESTIRSLSDVFKLLADRNRLKIVLALAHEDRMHVTALCLLLGQSQPAVSHHLTLMRMVGIVSYDRVGKNNYYFLASKHIRTLFEQFFDEMGDDLQSLQFEGFELSYRRT
jgi:ArsR family transcriptional regulator